MWNEIRKIEEEEINEYIVEGLFKLIELTNKSYEELERRFNVLNNYQITPAHEQHQRMVLYFIRYEINRLTKNTSKKYA